MPESKFWTFVLILLFGGSVAAIGIHDIHRQYGVGAYRQRDAQIEPYYGTLPLERARFAPRGVVRRDDWQRAQGRDSLSGSDRRELNSLLDSVVR